MPSFKALVLAAALTVGALPLAAAPVMASTDESATIPAALARTYIGGDLRIVKDLGGNSRYTRHAIAYRAGDMRITGIMTKPRGKGPFPVVVLAHGYIDPDEYWSGQGFRREQDWLARNGYIALHVDYRNHAGSSKDPDNNRLMRLGYAEDVIGAGLAVRDSTLPFIDNENIAVLGRSMGGSVVYQALVLQPGLFDAAITYASTSTKVADNFNKWVRNDYPISKEIMRSYGSPEDNPALWERMSSRNYFDRITEPVLAIHGTKDEECPIAWARATQAALTRAGVDATLKEYPGAKHYMYGEWADSIRLVDRFLERHLDDPPA